MPYVAVHQIEKREKGKGGVRKTIAPGKPYSPANDKERDDLLARGAIRLVEGPVVAEQNPEPRANDGDLELENMTKAQLLKFAEDNQIEVTKTGSKSDLIAEITESGKGDDLV